ncbi:choline-sulfatase [Vallitalea longa]|uniref:Choline-sulfatase n=1 Tax=Vallitalea longa TaxID=2936439 RepID=A0A9W5Y7Y3_9FIRM|nr:sulfatase-like hydrolase/transferase [Vallitalea longa]GKX27576.1 choline-sulfatase [Vallitalea longa]
MNKKDILIFLSDQHSPLYWEFNSDWGVKTPNLVDIAGKGTFFNKAYTSCPLCVPARMSMLCGQLPSKTHIYNNKGALPEDKATFLHMLAIEGYETVLCGRMHFNGVDQRHGFTKRIMGDITKIYWGESYFRNELGPLCNTVGANGCLNYSGGGISPIIEYDRQVVQKALEYLSEKHDKPQCIVVGTYAPHFTYIAPPDLYDYYKEIVVLPKSMKNKTNHDHPVLQHRKQKAEEKKIKSIRAAYFGMITNMDREIGKLHSKWKEYLDNYDREGIFIYMSDHGDQIGEHDMYGKQTFFEGASRIPLIFEGDGIQEGSVIDDPVSIMDLGPTLCQLTGSNMPPVPDGKSLMKQLTNDTREPHRYIISEFVENIHGKIIPGRMIRQDKWKLITYAYHEEYDLLFDMEEDPYELNNVADYNNNIVQKLRNTVQKDWDIPLIIEKFKENALNHNILNDWSLLTGSKEKERWAVPQEFVKIPVE